MLFSCLLSGCFLLSGVMSSKLVCIHISTEINTHFFLHHVTLGSIQCGVGLLSSTRSDPLKIRSIGVVIPIVYHHNNCLDIQYISMNVYA